MHFSRHQSFLHGRIILAEELCHFGAHGGIFQQQLDAAYTSFRTFCVTAGIRHSQPPFTARLVSWHIALASLEIDKELENITIKTINPAVKIKKVICHLQG